MSDLNAFLHRVVAAPALSGPLAGVSVGVKANIAVAGWPFHAGIGAWANRVAAEDAEVIRRLRDAGAAICGVLNMEEAALGAKTDNPHFGPTHNPHRYGYSPGGSSGGSGAAVAAGECDAALGTDTLGSVRIPAAHCGVYGFKPATDRVSPDGLEPAHPAFDAIGPLARDLDLLERIARVISRFGDGASTGEGAVLVGHAVELDSVVNQACDAAVTALPAAPAKEVLDYPAGRIRYAAFMEVSRFLADHLRGVAVSDQLSRLLAHGPQRPLGKQAEDRGILVRTREQVRHIVAERGFLLLPTVPNPPFPHDRPEPAAQADFTCLANIAGLPALALPAGWTAEGLPVGVQIVGREGHEQGLFALARQLDGRLRAYRPPNAGESP
ncbi:amidase [Porphyrobacter sp. GA68]|uniref:amidase n=1 Tax=Porphyrobacter sp. GA68 TaxID=2883480 RepID=UPI001D193A3F|nr:amidase [Porphyrobacter sp. GA68]